LYLRRKAFVHYTKSPHRRCIHWCNCYQTQSAAF